MKRITLELSDAAFARLRQYVTVSGISDSSSPLAPVMERIVRDIEEGRVLCTLKTREERENEGR